MKKLIISLAVIALLLTACAATDSQTPQVPQTTQPAGQPAEPTAASGDAPIAEPTAAATEVQPTRAPAPTEDTGYGAAAEDGSAQPALQDALRVFQFVSSETTASYEVGETFLNRNNQFNLAIGMTSAVDGEITLNFNDPNQSSLGTVTVDLSSLTSDSSRRDNAIRQNWLESARFPVAIFTPQRVEGLPEEYNFGEEIQFTVSGDLTVRDVSRPVTFQVRASLADDTLTGQATTDVLMTDFNFNPPDIAGVLKAQNEVKIVIDFTAVPKA